eukprot:Pgem_evm1s20229
MAQNVVYVEEKKDSKDFLESNSGPFQVFQSIQLNTDIPEVSPNEHFTLKKEEQKINDFELSKDEDLKLALTLMEEESDEVAPQANFMTYVVILFSCIGAAMFGIDQGNFGNVQGFHDFQTNFCLGKYGDETSCYGKGAVENEDWQYNFVLWGAALITFGSAFGALLLGPVIAPNLGRRWCIAVGAFITIVGCVVAAFLSFGITAVFFVGRFITGFGVGVACYALPMYSAELSPANIRGATGSLFQFNVVLGSFISTIITLYMFNWQVGIMLPAFPAFFLCIGIWFCPESPRFLIKKKTIAEAETALRTIRKGDISQEATAIEKSIEEERNLPDVTYTGLFLNKNVWKRVVIASVLQCCQQLTGVNVFLGYANTLFQQIGITDPLTFNVIFNAVMLVGVIIGLFLMDRSWWWCGRKSQLLIGSMFMAPALLVVGVNLLCYGPGNLSMVFVCLYAFGFQIGWGPICWVYTSEIFEMQYKEKAMSIAVFTQYLANAIIIVITPFMTSWNIGAALLIFCGLNFIGFFFVLFFIKETKGVDLEDIPALFENRQKNVEA